MLVIKKIGIPTKKDIMRKLYNCTVFSSFNAASGFWQIALDSECVKLARLSQCLGVTGLDHLSFGITSAPEIVQFKMNPEAQ